jgi:transketolase
VTTPEFLTYEDFLRIRQSKIDRYARVQLLADLCRFNTLLAVKRAGSGHLGSSFSAMDLVAWLYFEKMNTAEIGVTHPDRDVYFSSKGHDVPGLYSVLHAVGVLPIEKLMLLRRFNGLDGHPEVHIPGIEANSGSLGMGISKARGMVWAKRSLGKGGQVFVLTGDGELQEGQNYEALRAAVHQDVGDLTVIVDNNRWQTDRPVSAIMGLGNLEAVVDALGWYVHRFDGHDFRAIEKALSAAENTDKPAFLIADTIKGKGVSFMEPPADNADQHIYRWHSGAPDNESFMKGVTELRGRIEQQLAALKLAPVLFPNIQIAPPAPKAAPKGYVADAYGKALLELGARHPELVVLDGDLSADCRIRGFEEKYPERFIENGIAEQDMVSMAGGLARQGMLPVVNSFASFLASRANEQIYNNATEHTKIIYALHFAGMIPAGPGKSHQSVRDISLFAALPNCTILQPGTPEETTMAVSYCVEQATETCALRLAIGPSPRDIELPTGYRFTVGQGAMLKEGGDAVLIAYGPVMLHEALTAAEVLEGAGYELSVLNMPWLNRFDVEWLRATLEPFNSVFVLDDHATAGGLGERLLSTLVAEGLLQKRHYEVFALDEYPACGTPSEVLQHHQLDGASLAQRISRGRAFTMAAADEALYSIEAPQ